MKEGVGGCGGANNDSIREMKEFIFFSRIKEKVERQNESMKENSVSLTG